MERAKGVIAGAGYFAGVQAEAWRRLRGVEVLAVADPVLERAREFALRWGIPRAYASVAKMLKEERPDFLDIATRPDTHVELTGMAADFGAQVICQKPMAPSWEDCLRMVAICCRAQVRLLIHENWRWQPWYREAKRLMEAGRFGRVFHVGFQMRTGDGRGVKPYPVQPYFREMPRLLVYEVAVHFFDLFRYFLGDIESVYCEVNRINPVILGEDYALVQVALKNGARGLIDANRVSGPDLPTVTLGTFLMEGDRARLRVSMDGRLWITDYGKDEVEHALEVPESGYKGDSVYAFQEHALGCLRTGSRCESEGMDYLNSVGAVFASYRSVSSGCREEVLEAEGPGENEP